VCGQVFVGREGLLDFVKFCWVWSSFVRCGQVLLCVVKYIVLQTQKYFMDDFIPFQTTFYTIFTLKVLEVGAYWPSHYFMFRFFFFLLVGDLICCIFFFMVLLVDPLITSNNILYLVLSGKLIHSLNLFTPS